jgi:hypothetical protein
MKTLRDDLRGTIAPAAGLVGAILIGFAGLAVDTTRAWLVEARMKSALDAAALIAARRIDEPTRNAEATALFWANFEQGGRSRNYLGGTVQNPTIAPVTGQTAQIRVSSFARVPTTLFSVIQAQEIRRDDFAIAQRAGTGLELAIVLDATSSMNQTVNGVAKIDSAKAAINEMLRILYAGRDRQPDLYVSVVPFTRSINIGTDLAAQNMLDMSAAPPSWTVGQWSGCIEARGGGNDLTDVAPTGAGRFRPFAWPSTFQQVGQFYAVGDNRNNCVSANAWPADAQGRRFCHGDNDWTYPGRTGPNASAVDTAMRGNYMYNFLRGLNFSAAASATPNLLCSPTRVQPLTVLRADVQAAVNGIQTPVRSGGTTIITGLQGGWYTLSPNFQNRWSDPNTAVANVPTLPRLYTQPNNRKAVVILTDGEDNWQFPYSETTNRVCGDSTRTVCAPRVGAAADMNYNAYGRVADWNTRFPMTDISITTSVTNTKNSADAALAARFSALCTAMKGAPNNIDIYVIGFEVTAGSSIETRLRNCATTRDGRTFYYASPTPGDLQLAFTRVANELVSLRLVE